MSHSLTVRTKKVLLRNLNLKKFVVVAVAWACAKAIGFSVARVIAEEFGMSCNLIPLKF